MIGDDQNFWFPLPFENPEIFYQALVAGTETPGVIPPDGLDGWDIISDWDVKKGKGKDDAVITDNGDPPPTGKLKYQVWRDGRPDGGGGTIPNDFADDAKFILMLRKARADGKALDIAHPIINQQGVFSVVTKSIGKLTNEGGGGLFTRTIEFLKWVEQPKSAGGTPKGSAESVDDAKKRLYGDPSDEAPPPDPNAELKKQFEEKVKEAQEAPDE